MKKLICKLLGHRSVFLTLQKGTFRPVLYCERCESLRTVDDKL